MFKIGDKVVYPMHGAGVIDNIESKVILGEERNYYTMKSPVRLRLSWLCRSFQDIY